MARIILTTNLNLTSHQLLAHPPTGLEREFDALLQIFAWSRSTTTSWEVLKGRWTNQSWRNGTSTHKVTTFRLVWLEKQSWRKMRSPHPLKLALRKPHITTIKRWWINTIAWHVRDSGLLEFWYEELRIWCWSAFWQGFTRIFWEGSNSPCTSEFKKVSNNEDPRSLLILWTQGSGIWLMDDGCRCPYSLANPASGFAEDLEQTLRHRGADSWQLGPMVFLLFLKKGTLLVTCSRILYRGEK